MEELVRRTTGETITVEIVTAAGLWATYCDPHQLESSLLNLVINSRDAMPEGGTLTIETSNADIDHSFADMREVAPGQYVCLSVTDTGAGMAPATAARAFDPFFTTKPIGQGTGLGLSMVYGFARQSEGHARIYSEIGTGTTVKIFLPRYQGAVEEGAAAAAGNARPGAHAGETVLLIEDELAVRELVLDVLKDLGYRALEAVDGPSGLEILRSNERIDLLVTDIGLPGMNGRQVADAAREHRPDLRVLFITGYAENAAITAGFLAPGMEMMTKPFAIDALARRIRDMIGA
jgi:CheY-like chemotaxis protein